MSIETPGQIEANALQTTASVTAGFVKNDASGNLLFGQAASAWDLVSVQDFAAAQGVPSHVTFSGLDGDNDEVYQLIFRGFVQVGLAGLGQPANLSLRFNGMTGSSSSLKCGLHSVQSGPTGIQGYTNQLFLWRTHASTASGTTAWVFGKWFIHAKSSQPRVVQGIVSYGNTSSGSSNRAWGQNMIGAWTNTAANVTSLEVYPTLPQTSPGGEVKQDWSLHLYKVKRS